MSFNTDISVEEEKICFNTDVAESSLTSQYFKKNESGDCSSEINDFSKTLLEMQSLLVRRLTSDKFKFNQTVEYVYNPLEYAYEVYSNFINMYCREKKKLLFLGMNPGPWGMMQTGVPFGDVNSVTTWLKVFGEIKVPFQQHPLKKVTGFDCKRIEVSGKRFWSLAQKLSNNNPYKFFNNAFVYNYFPLVLLSSSGKNITPADLKSSDQKLLQNICDETLLTVLFHLQVETVIAVGRFAEKRIINVLKNNKNRNIKVVYISHPSPRNPQSNKNWLDKTFQLLNDFDLLKYFIEPGDCKEVTAD